MVWEAEKRWKMQENFKARRAKLYNDPKQNRFRRLTFTATNTINRLGSGTNIVDDGTLEPRDNEI